MPFNSRFTLPPDDQNDIDASWFDKQKHRPVEKHDLTLRGWLNEQVDALRACHDGNISLRTAASIMTHSISTSSVPDVGSYSNDIKGVGTLGRS